MKKFIISLFFVTIIFITACGSQDSSAPQDQPISMSDLQEAMLKADTTLPELTNVSSEEENAELNFSYLSDLSYDLIDSYFYAYAKDGTAEEIAVIKLKDKNDAAAMMQSLHDNITQRQGTFHEYAPEQVAMTEKAVVTREGTYITLIISEKNGLIQQAFQASFE